ncbi:hypothetical protein COU54_02445 [Candidatus Pacearchaeota archaeon CG10_big_fil_rev_8_21_14_0_10_31_24]|nr:MAG: hypothetical protein COU54_02445 [Candidatus Pacearchaeota archaeon CG10_big_fil_rev_8_21_14_0_10_31_24]
MYNFLCGIEKEARKEFIDDVYSMLKPCGKIILRVKYIRYNPKEIIRSFVSFLYWTFVMGKRWQLGDVLLRSSKDEFCKSHYFTKKQIRILLNEKKYMINGDTIIIQKC